MGTFYQNLKISSGDIGGAVAEGILHDIRVNGLGLQGFPQVIVHRTHDGFQINICWEAWKSEFSLSESEAVAAVKQMKAQKSHYEPIFDRIQHAAAYLEQKSQNS